MESHSGSTKRIAKNTLMLYVRMLFSMLVSLYTSRVILQTLGAEDFGIYNVVGGVVAMFGFLNASMSGATSRFLTYSMGKENMKELKDVFSSALIIHIGIALFVFLLSETLGLWFLENKLVIPSERMNAARVVYQLSILSSMLGITQVPYNACIIAHEKMNIYAYVEMLNVILKLLIVYLLLIFGYDKLIVYAILMFFVTFTVLCIYRYYCLHNYKESHFKFVWNLSIIKPMLSFSGWDLYGNVSVMLRQQGVNIILNMFIGPIVNAANGIASSVNSVTMSFVGNIITAFRPQIIKLYATNNYDKMFSLMTWAVKICLTLFLMLAIPLIFEMRFVLTLWLHEAPQYTVDFCRIILMTSCFSVITFIVNIGIHASGKMFLISFLSGTLIWLAVPVIYILLRLGFHPNCAYVCNGVVSILVMFSNLCILKHNIIQFPIFRFAKTAILPDVVLGILLTVSLYLLHCNNDYGWSRFLFSVITSLLESCLFFFFILMNRSERITYIKKIKGKLWI